MQPEKNINHRTDQKSARFFLIMPLVVLLLALGIVSAGVILKKIESPFSAPSKSSGSQKKTFEDNFQRNQSIEETSKMSQSSSSDWWVNSGGFMEVGGGTGKTIQGELLSDSKWYKKYKDNNPEDTDNGLHPQNIFRLVTRSQWQDFDQETYFRINKVNLSESENRNESNGILLFNRYQDGDDLYYTGLRVDGSAIIKKKYGGKYYTLSEEKFFSGGKYDHDGNPNLLPLDEWIGLKSEFRNTDDGDVEIKLYVGERKEGEWKLAASVVDDGRKEYGKNIISDEGYAGIRTDFMDVEFSDYKIAEIK